MNKNLSFYDYLEYKYNILNKKLNKNIILMNNLKKKEGGAAAPATSRTASRQPTMLSLQMQTIQMQAMIKILGDKLRSPGVGNYSEIMNQFRILLNKLEESVQTLENPRVMDPTELAEQQRIINQMQQNVELLLDPSHGIIITTPGKGSVVSYQKPFFDLFTITEENKGILGQLNDGLKDIDKTIRDRMNDTAHLENTTRNITELLNGIQAKNTENDQRAQLLTQLNTEMDQYTKLNDPLFDKNFFDNNMMKAEEKENNPTELIKAEKLENLGTFDISSDAALVQSDSQRKIFKFFQNVDDRSDPLFVKDLVAPVFKKRPDGTSLFRHERSAASAASSSRGGSIFKDSTEFINSIATSSKTSIKNLIDIIYEQWLSSYSTAKKVNEIEILLKSLKDLLNDCITSQTNMDKLNKSIIGSLKKLPQTIVNLYFDQPFFKYYIDLNDYINTNLNNVSSYISKMEEYLNIEKSKKYLSLLKDSDQIKENININIEQLTSLTKEINISSNISDTPNYKNIKELIEKLDKINSFDEEIKNLLKEKIEDQNIILEYCKENKKENLQRIDGLSDNYTQLQEMYQKQLRELTKDNISMIDFNPYNELFNNLLNIIRSHSFNIDIRDIIDPPKEPKLLQELFDNELNSINNKYCNENKASITSKKMTIFDLINDKIDIITKGSKTGPIKKIGIKKCMYTILNNILIKFYNYDKIDIITDKYNKDPYNNLCTEFTDPDAIPILAYIKNILMNENMELPNKKKEFEKKLVEYNLKKQEIINILNKQQRSTVGGAARAAGPTAGAAGPGIVPKLNKEVLDNFNKNTIDFYKAITDYKTGYNKYRKLVDEFNLKYIQLNNHHLFIISYINIILIKDTYYIYDNVSRGTIYYYKYYVQYILDQIRNADKKNLTLILEYFYKYHYVTLLYLENFLKQLYNNWNSSGLHDYLKIIDLNSDTQHIDIKKGFFLFNIFKDIIDKFILEVAPSVGVYLRINDYKTDKRVLLPEEDLRIDLSIFEKKENPDYDQLKEDPLELCHSNSSYKDYDTLDNFFEINFADLSPNEKRPSNKKLKDNTPPLDLDELPQNRRTIKDLQFNKIFDTNEFKSNDNLSQFMGIPNYLSKGNSILFLTYGYSGVGKTYTVFGSNKNGLPQNGLLQNALHNIKLRKSIYVRIYEVYGVALPYLTYWKNKPSTKIHQYKLIDGKVVINSDINDNNDFYKKIESIPEVNDDDPLNNILNNNYQKLSDSNITNINKIVDEIDDIRDKVGRIKATPNNPVSSRSIMVYEFIIYFNQEGPEQKKNVKFIIMDLPGKENILSTYVTNTSEESKKIIKFKSQLNLNQYNEYLLKCALFINPLFLSLFTNISKKIISKFYDLMKNNYLFSIHNTEKCLVLRTLEYTFKEDLKSDTNSFFGDINNTDDKKKIICNEIMRILITEDNGINKIIDFYKSEIYEHDQSLQVKNTAAVSFEGVYINENITSLIQIFVNYLKKSDASDIVKIKHNYFTELVSTETINQMEIVTVKSENGPPTMDFNDALRIFHLSSADIAGNIYKNELLAQTYFIRNLLRRATDENKSQSAIISNRVNIGLFSDDVLKKNTISDEYGSDITYKYDKNRTSFKDLFEGGYNYNESFTSEPPIKDILDIYLGSRPKSDNAIVNNIYLFYLVSNNDYHKSANQIRLLADAKPLIDAIKNYIPNN